MPAKKRNKSIEQSGAGARQPAQTPGQAPETNTPHVLYLELDEEVANVIERVRPLAATRITLVIPSGSPLLGSAVNLRLLAQQMQKQGKEWLIVTKDKKGKRIASALGIPVLSELTGDQKPVVATTKSRSLTGKRPTPADKERFGELSIGDIVKKQRLKNKLAGLGLGKELGPDELEVEKQAAFSELSPNRKLLFLFVLITLMLVGTVFALVVPNTTIILTPKADTIEYLTNLTLADAKLNYNEIKELTGNLVPSYELETKGSKRHTYKTTGVASMGANASGYVTVINNTNIAWPLVATTRLRSENGIIFRLQKGVIVPPRSSARAPVVADPIDEFSKVVGERGNIGPTKFTIPGLRETNRQVVYAISKDSMSGGVTQAAQVASAEDLQAAQTDLVNRLVTDLNEILKQQTVAKSTNLGVDLTFLPLNNPTDITVVESGIEGDIKPNSSVTEMTAFATVVLRGLAFEKGRFYEILRRGMVAKVHPNMRLRTIDFDGINYRLLDRNEVLKKLKLEVKLRGVVEYDILEHYTSKLRSELAGKTLSEAKAYLQGQDFVAQANFQMWPFWLKKLPSVEENIRLVVKD